MKKFICLILAISIVLPGIFSCGENSESRSETQPEPQSESETSNEKVSAENTRSAISDDLPETDYKGRQFNFLCRTTQLYEYDVEEENGEIVNDALYRRNKTVEGRFNVNINPIDMDGSWGNMKGYKNTIANAAMSGDNVYDLVEGDVVIVDLLGKGYFVNLLDSKYINVEKPWWAKSSVEVLNVGGVLEFIAGDYSLLLWEGLCVVYFNKKLVADYGIESLYELVKNGKWTLGTVERLSRDIYKDLNGDGKAGPEDLYGLVATNGNMIDNFQTSCELKLASKDADGFPIFANPVDERSVSVVQKVFELVRRQGVFMYDETKIKEVHEVMFMENRGLFYTSFLRDSQAFRTMETDFGILPYPKYDEAQKDYKTLTRAGSAAFAIPVTVKDSEFAEIILEALCAESYRKVIPAYYDVALKHKYARDDDSSEMLDIIREGLEYDFANIALDYTEWVLAELRSMAAGSTFDWVSRMEQKKDKIDANLENLKREILNNR
ncbi:MAG: hypothetical protein FWD23_14040 [Oscillospiraceae bacterium]|nr:hypothetical protein [Oscillospiraceae bacterium]